MIFAKVCAILLCRIKMVEFVERELILEDIALQ